jgi:hypothetical protein
MFSDVTTGRAAESDGEERRAAGAAVPRDRDCVDDI